MEVACDMQLLLLLLADPQLSTEQQHPCGMATLQGLACSLPYMAPHNAT